MHKVVEQLEICLSFDSGLLQIFNDDALSIMKKLFSGDEAGIGDATGIPASA